MVLQDSKKRNLRPNIATKKQTNEEISIERNLFYKLVIFIFAYYNISLATYLGRILLIIFLLQSNMSIDRETCYDWTTTFFDR